MNIEFPTKRVQFAVFLHATRLLPYLRSEPRAEGKVRFVFKDDQRIGSTIELEYDHGAPVPARDLFSSQTFLRVRCPQFSKIAKMEKIMSTNPALVVDPSQIALIAREGIAAVKRKHALRNHTDALTDTGRNTRHIINGLLPERQLGVLIGNGGRGKSPLLYQLGIAAASGSPFLANQAVPTDVLLLDFENGGEASGLLERQIANFLELPEVPDNFLRWNGDDCAANFGQTGQSLTDSIKK